MEPGFPFAEGPRDYQLEALNTWKYHGYQGFFAMATGTGKTITALNCILDTYIEDKRYRGLILVPTIALVEQWQREARRFNFSNIIKISSKERHWKDNISRITASSFFDKCSSYLIISTYASLAKTEVVGWLEDLPSDTIVIADEAHNLGTPLLMQAMIRLPFWRRLGLSATPKRQFDHIGNESINRYFNISDGYSFEYPMSKAIENGILCHYDYYPHLVQLSENEMSDYYELSKKIAKFFDPITETFDESPILTALLIKRKRIIHKASAKIPEFENIVKSIYTQKGSLQYTMVYAPEGVCPDEVLYSTEIDDRDDIEDDDLPMINLYTRIVRDVSSKTTVEQFTSKDSDRDRILIDFTEGRTNVLVAMKCLDEGIDVPRAENAIFCASTGNPRQFIQRRGRILRVHPDKKKALIHDIVVTPYIDHSFESFQMERSLIKNELRRVRDFAMLSDNADTAEITLNHIIEYYGLNLFEDE